MGPVRAVFALLLVSLLPGCGQREIEPEEVTGEFSAAQIWLDITYESGALSSSTAGTPNSLDYTLSVAIKYGGESGSEFLLADDSGLSFEGVEMIAEESGGSYVYQMKSSYACTYDPDTQICSGGSPYENTSTSFSVSDLSTLDFNLNMMGTTYSIQIPVDYTIDPDVNGDLDGTARASVATFTSEGSLLQNDSTYELHTSSFYSSSTTSRTPIDSTVTRGDGSVTMTVPANTFYTFSTGSVSAVYPRVSNISTDLSGSPGGGRLTHHHNYTARPDSLTLTGR